jgi:hypothetical protein
MTRAEWAELVKRMNASFPNRPVDPATAAEWLEELNAFDAASVWLAIRRCRRERPFAPALAQILEAIDANDREDRERQRAAQVLAHAPGRRGARMPAEMYRAMEVHADRLDGKLDGETARGLIDTLADQLDARLAHRSADDDPALATRTCVECAISPIEGQVFHTLPADHPENSYQHPVEVCSPCPRCRPVRAKVLTRGGQAAMTLRTDADGWPKGWRQ